MLASAAMLGAQVVEGSVTNSVTRIGVSDVQVRMGRMVEPKGAASLPTQEQQITETQQVLYEALTDISGKFRFDGVKDGRYSIQWFREGFYSVSSNWVPVEVKAGDPLELDLKMTPLGRVTGRVLDGKKHPVAGAKLELSSGSAGPVTRVAEEDGTFAMENVPGGTYTLLAYAPGELDPPDPVDGKLQAWAPTFYPGIIYSDSASRIVVTPGGEVTGLEIKLVAVPVWQVSGVVLGPDGKPVPVAGVHLTKALGRNLLSAETDGEGKFALATTDGTYRVSAAMTADEGTLYGESEVVVAGKDVNEVELRIKAPFSTHGIFLYDPPRPTESKSRVQIFLSPDSSIGRAIFNNVKVEGDTFTIPNLYPGTYYLLASEPEPPYYLASVRVSGQDGMAGPMYLGSGNDQAEVVFRADGGTVSGSVEDGKGCWLSLLPVEQNLWKPSQRMGRCDDFGHFTIPALRPGDYYAVAATPSASGVPPLELAMPTVRPASIQRVLQQATKLTVRSGETTRVDLKVVKLEGQ